MSTAILLFQTYAKPELLRLVNIMVFLSTSVARAKIPAFAALSESSVIAKNCRVGDDPALQAANFAASLLHVYFCWLAAVSDDTTLKCHRA